MNPETDRPEPRDRAADTAYLTSRWPMLPPHIREAIVALVDAGLTLYDAQHTPPAATTEGDA